MKVLISTDSSCLINYEILKKNNVSVFPLNVIIDGEEFLDNVTISQDELLKAIYVLTSLLEYHICLILGIDIRQKIVQRLNKVKI